MPSADDDHDQRFKVMLKEFIEQFFQCFFPDWAQCLDFHDVTWLDKELFLAPPKGKKRRVDLVARLRIRPGMAPPRPGASTLVALVHIEVQSRRSVQRLRPRMFQYYVQLQRDSQLPVLPIGLFLRVGLNGIGWDTYEEHFWEQRLLHFTYAYVGLPALEGEQYARGEHLLGVALSVLMRAPAERRAELHAEALKRIARSSENDYRRFLLAECVEAYSDLDEDQRERLEELLTTEPYQEVRPLMMTTYERGKIEGKIEGQQEGRRQMALDMMFVLLGAKFGQLSPDIRKRVEALSPEQLQELAANSIKAQSLKDLGLGD
jgi:Domain of unknown function (DUF4351)